MCVHQKSKVHDMNESPRQLWAETLLGRTHTSQPMRSSDRTCSAESRGRLGKADPGRLVILIRHLVESASTWYGRLVDFYLFMPLSFCARHVQHSPSPTPRSGRFDCHCCFLFHHGRQRLIWRPPSALPKMRTKLRHNPVRPGVAYTHTLTHAPTLPLDMPR